MSALIWGVSGCGKTTLAATAPGKKLWINFDPDGTASIASRDDVLVFDLSSEPDRIVEEAKKEDPFGLTHAIEQQEINTVVIDSLTTFGEKALSHGVVRAQGTSKGKSSTLEDPGFSGYGNKNTWTRLFVKNLLQATAKMGTNVIFIAHEDKPVTDEQGIVLFISIMLGSSLNQQVPLNISEVWTLTDTKKGRMIAIRPCRGRQPMKSRMFKSSVLEFPWRYDADTDEGEGIADWMQQWKDNDFRKIDCPS